MTQTVGLSGERGRSSAPDDGAQDPDTLSSDRIPADVLLTVHDVTAVLGACMQQCRASTSTWPAKRKAAGLQPAVPHFPNQLQLQGGCLQPSGSSPRVAGSSPQGAGSSLGEP
eukprot:53206-Chlamydomonas_euryale.AAC.3